MNLQPTHVSHEIIYETTRRVVISVSWEREEKKEKVERKGENERKKTMRLHHVPGNYIWAVKPSRDAGWPLTKVGKCNKIWCHDNDWRQIRWQKRAKFLFKKANSKKKKIFKEIWSGEIWNFFGNIFITPFWNLFQKVWTAWKFIVFQVRLEFVTFYRRCGVRCGLKAYAITYSVHRQPRALLWQSVSSLLAENLI